MEISAGNDEGAGVALWTTRPTGISLPDVGVRRRVVARTVQVVLANTWCMGVCACLVHMREGHGCARMCVCVRGCVCARMCVCVCAVQTEGSRQILRDPVALGVQLAAFLQLTVHILGLQGPVTPDGEGREPLRHVVINLTTKQIKGFGQNIPSYSLYAC